jgi:hypothetical protein
LLGFLFSAERALQIRELQQNSPHSLNRSRGRAGTPLPGSDQVKLAQNYPRIYELGVASQAFFNTSSATFASCCESLA